MAAFIFKLTSMNVFILSKKTQKGGEIVGKILTMMWRAVNKEQKHVLLFLNDYKSFKMQRFV